MDQVSLVIPNWNGLAHLRECLDSVASQAVRPAETVLVDNGSTDASVSFVREVYPWVTVIQLDRNRGFAVAVNRGIAAGATPYVALLNNDTRLDPGWLKELLQALGETPNAGMAACRMLNFFHPGDIDAAGDILTRSGAPFSRGSGEPDDGRYSHPGYVFGACAGAALYRRKLFEAIGLFDEDFVSYYEDADLSCRAQLAGWKCLYVPAAVCYHKRGATAGTLPYYPVRMQERNLLALYVKNYPASALLRKAPMIAASRIRNIYRAMRMGAGRPVLAGFLGGLRLLPRMLGKRREIQRLRRIPVDAFVGFMGNRS
jgi:GT2 family glycosyltransferase